MKYYNLYYKNERLNNRPMSKDDVINNVLSNKKDYIYKAKVFDGTSQIVKINLKDIKIVDCIVV